MTEKLEPCPVCLSKEDPDYWQKHLDLARRAEIGRIVEENAAKTTAPISITQDERGWHVAWEWTRIQRDSLLDALRALESTLKENER